MESLRAHALVSVVSIACTAGGGRTETGTSVGVNEDSTGSTDASATDSVSGPDGSDGGPTGDAEATSVSGDTTGVDADSTGDGATEGPALPCDEDPNTCDAWFLPRGGNAWEAVTIGGPAALAPNSAVLAAFDIEADRIAFVITQDEVIEVDLEARTWEAKTMVADRFPEVEAPVSSAYSIPAYWGGKPDAPEGITIAGSDVAFLYTYANGTFTYDQSTVFGPEWDGPGAPAGADVRAMWLDVTNDDGWVTNDLSDLCETSGPVGPYLAVVTADAVHPMDVGVCFDFFPGVAYAEFGPLALPGAPPPDRVGGAAYNETTGLVVFAGE